VAGYHGTVPQLSTGIVAPDFELFDLAGIRHHLGEALEAGPVALVFSKSSCPTCQFTLPYIARLHRASGLGSLATIWGVSQDDPEETAEFVGQHSIGFPMLIDEHPYEVSAGYGIEFVPALFIMGKDGVIAESDWGFSKSSLNAVAEVLACPVELFPPGDRLPPRRPGCRSKNG
jgi:peroxiredoxin